MIERVIENSTSLLNEWTEYTDCTYKSLHFIQKFAPISSLAFLSLEDFLMFPSFFSCIYRMLGRGSQFSGFMSIFNSFSVLQV